MTSALKLKPKLKLEFFPGKFHFWSY